MEDSLKYILGSPATIGAISFSLALVGYIIARGLNHSSASKGARFPPGPPRDFLIGNLRQFPKDHFYAKFCEWQEEYGDIVSVEIPGMPLLILNSYDTVQDLLAKRPSTTGGRNIGYMIMQMMGLYWSVAHIQPGPHFSEQRKMFRRGIGPQRIGSHNDKIEKHTTRLMLELRHFKGSPRKLIQRTVGRGVIEVAYGEKMLNTIGDELLSWNGEEMHLYEENFVKFYLVDILNFLRFIPSWIPGADFRKIGNRSTWLTKQIRYVPFEKAKELYKSGEIGHSLVTDLIDEFGPTDDVRDAAAVLYLAGVETTTAAIVAYFHAIYLFPEIARKVYEEIVAVTGGSRMPTIADRPALRYTEAVWKESFRWNTFAPLGIPHFTVKDEMLKGYFIKAGTTIHYNNGFILSDPKVWGDPETFRPERFLAPDAEDLPNPLVIIFGYGMRVCPGMYLADRTGFQIASSLSALYNVVPLENRSRTKPDSVEYTDSLLRLPENFECHFVPRNAEVEQILKTSALDS